MSEQTIYVAGYPKSGTVFITRLLGDALDSPTGAYWNSRDGEDISAEGGGRKGKYVVRRGHFRLLNKSYPSLTPVPAPHKLAWRALTGQRLVCIMRDPRDVATSAHFYYHQGQWAISKILKDMRDGTGSFSVMGPWDAYMSAWNALPYHPMSLVKFERLAKDPFRCLKEIVADLEIDAPTDAHMQEACNRQSFAAKKQWIESTTKPLPLGKGLNLKHMRKGKPGDWKNHFTEKEKRMARTFFGKTMAELGYDPNE